MWHFPVKMKIRPTKKRHPDCSQFYNRNYHMRCRIDAALDPGEAIYDIYFLESMVCVSCIPSQFSVVNAVRNYNLNTLYRSKLHLVKTYKKQKSN